MKKITALLLICLMLAGCGNNIVATVTNPTPEPAPAEKSLVTAPEASPVSPSALEYKSRFSQETQILLSDNGIAVDGGEETASVYTSRDIVYYEDRDAYDSGNLYGEGEAWEKHTAEEAAKHMVVNITAPGAYRLSGTLSAGQIRVDLGENAQDDPEAVVELILDGADITCTVAPAILFQNVYECDGSWSEETAAAQADTTAAGASLILAGDNTVTGSHVARIYQDNDKEKKLWKQDGAIYSYMSMNVFGPGSLTLTADNEGLDTELHLTIHGGDITIRSDNDGINTNEDNVSVTTINGGRLHIVAGLGTEGDGIDSNGYLVINGGQVISYAHPASDGGLDSTLGTYIHGGTVIALGAAQDWADSASSQVTLNLQFASAQDGALVVEAEDGSIVFAYDSGADEILAGNRRQYRGAILSCPELRQDETYFLFTGGTLTGEETSGIYSSVTAYRDGIQMGYTNTDTGSRPGGNPSRGMEPPEGFDAELPQDRKPPKDASGKKPEERPSEGVRDVAPDAGSLHQAFLMTELVNAFSGISPLEK